MYIKNTAPTIARRPLSGKNSSLSGHSRRGFALVATIMLMILLMLLAVGMLSLSTVSLRSSNTDSANQQARANARMALMIAIGELQKEMGPDMRISAEAAIYDTNPATEEIDGIAQAHWLAVYDSWGNYLNGEYTPDGKSASEVRTIADTYVAKRAPMFRRWLVSLPDNLKNDVNAADAALSEEETVLMVGEGTLGKDHAAAHPEKVTRAYKIQTHNSGAFAWWVSPENHKAKINLAAQKRNLKADQWAVGQGVSSEVAVGGLTGLESLNIDKPDAASLAQRIISLKTTNLPSVSADQDASKQLFFDLTEASSGVLANTRSGGLKKDLSLLFENNDKTIAPQYTQANRFAPEPSIRPHSKDVLSENAALPRRPFASWPNMRHYYRMYRTSTDTPYLKEGYDISKSIKGGKRELISKAGVPSTEMLAPWNMRESDKDIRWFGENAYLRFPVLARFLVIHAYQTERYFEPNNNTEEIAFHYYDIPVVTFWNPYSTPLIVKNGSFGAQVATTAAWPNKLQMYDSSGKMVGFGNQTARVNSPVPLKTKDGSDIVFQPGEFKVFSFLPGFYGARRDEDLEKNPNYGLFEGFDPSGTGGMTDGGPKWFKRVSDKGVFLDRDFEVMFDRAKDHNGNPTNCSEGNAPGSLTLKTGPAGDFRDDGIPPHYQIDWFQNSQLYQSITRDEGGGLIPLIESENPLPVGYSLLTLKSTSRLDMPATWANDWRSRNWLHAPPSHFGSGLYMSEDVTTAQTQRLDSPYEVSFGPTSPSELIKLTGEINGKPWLGFGSNPYEKVTAVPAIELPSAPLSSLASFSGMRMSPGWIWSKDLNPEWVVRQRDGQTPESYPVSLYNGSAKVFTYQSGITGGGIGNSFVHPMIPRNQVYFYHDNSKSQEHARMDLVNDSPTSAKEASLKEMKPVETKAYSDYWDHALMLNDALWDEYFISSIADQTRPWASESDNLQTNIEALTANEGLPISRYQYHNAGLVASAVEAKLKQDDAYLKAAEHLMVDGAFNVNSTSVNAWYALFKGIRERKLFYRNASGAMQEVTVPDDHIAISRFDTPTSDKEATDPGSGVARADGHMEWSGVRFLDDRQIQLLAEKCVEQVKKRGPFLNFSEFINRRLEDNEMGLKGALQSAIDFDDASPDAASINYRYKQSSSLMMTSAKLGTHEFPTPEAANGSRLAGIPGYVIQSDLLKPISNTLQVRDDTFRIRAYGEALDAKGKVTARAWCEAIIQRTPDYMDENNTAHEGAFNYEASPSGGFDPRWDGEFVPNSSLTATNRQFGRKFEMISFRWLNSDEI